MCLHSKALCVCVCVCARAHVCTLCGFQTGCWGVYVCLYMFVCIGVYVCVYVCSMHVLDWQLGYAVYIRDIYIRCVGGVCVGVHLVR